MHTARPEVFLGRQPILDRARQVVAYELLFRSENHRSEARVCDDAIATARVIAHAFRDLGIHSVVGGSRAFINMDAESLLSRNVESLPPEKVVLEVLETVNIDDRVVHRCQQLKRLGFRLALDDFFYIDDVFEPLLEIVDVIKIDTMKLSLPELARLVERLRLRPAKLLAEKVDTPEKWDACRLLGFKLFQGFLFSRPVLLTA